MGGRRVWQMGHAPVGFDTCDRVAKGTLSTDRSQGSTYVADNDGDSDEARTLRPLQAAACTYRIAFGPRAGQKVLTLQGAMPRDADFKQTLCADIQGNSAARRRALRRR